MNKAALMAAMQAAIREETVPVDGVGEFRLREMTAGARDQFDRSLFNPETQQPDSMHYQSKLVRACLVDSDTNQLMFGPTELDQVLAFHPDTLDALFVVAERLNGLDKSALERAEKN